jgi:hypothetical protein
MGVIAQSGHDLSGIVEPPHMCETAGNEPISVSVVWIFLDRKKESGYRSVEAFIQEVHDSDHGVNQRPRAAPPCVKMCAPVSWRQGVAVRTEDIFLIDHSADPRT